MHKQRTALVGLLAIVGALLAPGSPAASQVASLSPQTWNFRRAEAPHGAGPLGLTAVAARGAVIALGDADGVQLSVSGSAYERVVRSGRVQDLFFDPSGSLWVSATDGLFHLAADGRVSRRSPGAGEAGRLVTRMRVAAGLHAAATGGGLYWSRDGRQWSSRVASLSNGPVTALALRPLAGDNARVEVWAIAGGFPWRLIVRIDAQRFEVERAQRVSISGRPSGSAPVDVALDVGGASVVVAYPRALALRGAGESWKIVRPVLPPGAVIRRVSQASDRVWLLSDRGLLDAGEADGNFRRSASPAGTSPSAAVAESSGQVLVASEQGLLAGTRVEGRRLVPATQGGAKARSAREVEDPAIHELHAAALRYLELGPSRVRELREGLDRRGWLPLMSVRFDYGADRDTREDWDQSYISGGRRDLYDYERAKARDIGAAVQLTWDLGDTLYNPEAIELSREARQRIALRDDALDEINQLYFERRNVLFSIAALPSDADPIEAERLWLRAQELAAGLDGWTGGWFSQAARVPR